MRHKHKPHSSRSEFPMNGAFVTRRTVGSEQLPIQDYIMQIDTSSLLDSGYMYDIGRIGCSKTHEKASREAAVKSRSDEALNVFLDSPE